MIHKKNIFIKQLDFGYIISVEGKERAIPDADRLHQALQSMFRVMTDRASHQGINNFTISIEVDENVPTVK